MFKKLRKNRALDASPGETTAPSIDPEPTPDASPDASPETIPTADKSIRGQGFMYLYLAAFSLNLAFIPNTLLLHILQKSVNPVLSMAFQVFGFLCFALFFILFIRRTGTSQIQNYKMLNAVAGLCVSVLLLYLVTFVFAIAARFALPYLPALIRFDQGTILWLALWAIALLVLLLMLFSGVTLLTAATAYALRPSDMGRAYGLVVKKMLTAIYKTLPYSVFSGLCLYGANALQNLFLQGLEGFLIPGFYRNFIFYTLGSLLNAGLFWMVISLSKAAIKSLHEPLLNLASREHHRKIPMFAVVLLLAAIGITVAFVPLGKDASDSILAEVALHNEKGDALVKMGLTIGGIYEYDMAYSKVLALKGYLYGLRYLEGKSTLQVDLETSENSLIDASAIAPGNPYVAYFRGMLYQKNGNVDGAIAAFQQAVLYKNGVVSSYFGLLEAYRQKAQPKDVQHTLKILENTETYTDAYAVIASYKIKKIDAVLDKVSALEANLGPKMVYKALERSHYGDASGALSELMKLQVLYPTDLQINYQIARIANDYRDEQNNYGKVVQYAELFDQLSAKADAETGDLASGTSAENEAERKLFVAQMYLGANALDQALQLLKEAVATYPSHTELSLQYAYTLNQAERPDEALSALKVILEREPTNREALNLQAIAYLLKKDAPSALAAMGQFIKAANEANAISLLDKNLYNYCIIFYKVFPGTEGDAALAALGDQPLLAAYLEAVKGWKNKDSQASNQALEKVLKLNSGLGYPYYMMGVNYYENTVRNNETDFSKAAAYYQESLKYLPQHAEGYFALGHCYLKWGKKLEALRAFRKVVDLMPYEDHRVDPYGMTVHAYIQVNELMPFDVKEAK